MTEQYLISFVGRSGVNVADYWASLEIAGGLGKYIPYDTPWRVVKRVLRHCKCGLERPVLCKMLANFNHSKNSN